jgi:hypothetical protein
MAYTTYLVGLVSTVSNHCKNELGRDSASSRHIIKLELFTFLRYLWMLRSFCWPRGLKEDPTVWLGEARKNPISLNI